MSTTSDHAPPGLATTSTRSRAVPVLTRRVLPHLLLLGVFAALVRLAAVPLNNGDTYFHLRFGHEFLDGGWSLREPGSVSSFGTASWSPTQWLPQIVMAKTEDWFGLPGVAWLSGLLFVTLATTYYAAARRWSDPIVAMPVVLGAIIASASGLSMRPQVLSYILVTVSAVAWLAAAERGRPPWWLVPLTWVWAMCHGMWPVGIIIGVAAVAGIALDGQGRRVWGPMALVPIASALVSMLTPVGPQLFSAVLLVNSRGQYFSEWGPPVFVSPTGLALLALLGVTLVVMARRGRTSWLQILLLGLAGGWAVYSARTVPVAAALLVPLAAQALQSGVGARTGPNRTEKTLVATWFVTALAVLALLVPSTSANPSPQPAWVDPALSSLPEGTKVLDSWAFGGYLLWRYPHLDLVIHGYGDVFTDKELERNDDLEDVSPDWQQLVRDTEAHYAVVDPNSRLGHALRDQADWIVLHDDDDVQMLRAPPDWLDEG